MPRKKSFFRYDSEEGFFSIGNRNASDKNKNSANIWF